MIVPLVRPFKSYMEVDYETGRILFPADGPTHRFEGWHRDQITDWGRADGIDMSSGIKAVIDENILIGMARELMFAHNLSKLDAVVLEDWVNEQTNNDYDLATEGLFWAYELDEDELFEIR